MYAIRSYYVCDEETLGANFEVQEIAPQFAPTAREYREKLIETVAEFDDEIMEAYVAEAPVDTAKLVAAIRKATIGLKLVPVLCGTALKNKGIQPLLDAIVQFLPSPLDVPPIEGVITSYSIHYTKLYDPFQMLSATAS